MKRLIAGNWKMHGLTAAQAELAALAGMLTPKDKAEADVMICPPATLVASFAAAAAGTGILVGAQDCHPAQSGAHTGDISAEMLADAGATAVIVGHSERRADHGEANGLVKQKAQAAHRAGLTAIVCVGESHAQREAGQAVGVVSEQLTQSLPDTDGPVVVAYEPVWAIGTGLVPSLDDIAEIQGLLRELTEPDTRLLYGGSVKPVNAGAILSTANVNGALVGGASLKAADFYGIIAPA